MQEFCYNKTKADIRQMIKLGNFVLCGPGS